MRLVVLLRSGGHEKVSPNIEAAARVSSNGRCYKRHLFSSYVSILKSQSGKSGFLAGIRADSGAGADAVTFW